MRPLCSAAFSMGIVVFLNLIVEGSRDNLVLLLLCELDEVNRVAAYSDGKLGVLLGVRLRVEKRFAGENVNVKMMSALLDVSVKERYEVVYLIFCCCHFLCFLSLRFS